MSATAAITNFDMFEELFNYIKDPETSINDAIKEFGGSNIYIPSYKTTCRNDEIIDAYKQSPTKQTIRELARKHGLSESQIYIITKPLREPPLF